MAGIFAVSSYNYPVYYPAYTDKIGADTVRENECVQLFN